MKKYLEVGDIFRLNIQVKKFLKGNYIVIKTENLNGLHITAQHINTKEILHFYQYKIDDKIEVIDHAKEIHYFYWKGLRIDIK